MVRYRRFIYCYLLLVPVFAHDDPGGGGRVFQFTRSRGRAKGFEVFEESGGLGKAGVKVDFGLSVFLAVSVTGFGDGVA